MNGSLKDELGPIVLKQIQEAYNQGQIVKTNDCVNDMANDGFYEADVKKIIMNANIIEKAMPATSERASNPNNTHYVIPGESTAGIAVYCKICSNYHRTTNEFICWALTSFCKKHKAD
jgi:hypothetical protein